MLVSYTPSRWIKSNEPCWWSKGARRNFSSHFQLPLCHEMICFHHWTTLSLLFRAAVPISYNRSPIARSDAPSFKGLIQFGSGSRSFGLCWSDLRQWSSESLTLPGSSRNTPFTFRSEMSRADCVGYLLLFAEYPCCYHVAVYLLLWFLASCWLMAW